MVHGCGGPVVSLGCRLFGERRAETRPLLPSREHITLIGIDEAGPPSSPSGFGEGTVAQPAMNGSFSYPNARGNLSRFKPLVMKFNDLRVAIQLLCSPPFSR